MKSKQSADDRESSVPNLPPAKSVSSIDTFPIVSNPEWDKKLQKLLETDQRQRDGAMKGGRRKPDRDREIAEEYGNQRELIPRAGKEKSGVSDSELKFRIGKKYRLGRSASIDAINRGLEAIERDRSRKR